MKSKPILSLVFSLISITVFSQIIQMDDNQRVIFYENYVKSDYAPVIQKYYEVDAELVNNIAQEVCAYAALETKSKLYYGKQATERLAKKRIITKNEKRHFNKIMKFLSEEDYFSFWIWTKSLYDLEDKSNLGLSYCAYYDSMSGAFGFDSFYHMAQQFLDLASQNMMPEIGLLGDFGIPYADASIFGRTPIDVGDILAPPTLGGQQISNVNFAAGGGESSGSNDGYTDEQKAAYVATYTAAFATTIALTAGALTALTTSPSGPAAVAAGGGAAIVGFEVGAVIGAAIATTHVAVYSIAKGNNKSDGNFMDPCAPNPPDDCYRLRK